MARKAFDETVAANKARQQSLKELQIHNPTLWKSSATIEAFREALKRSTRAEEDRRETVRAALMGTEVATKAREKTLQMLREALSRQLELNAPQGFRKVVINAANVEKDRYAAIQAALTESLAANKARQRVLHVLKDRESGREKATELAAVIRTLSRATNDDEKRAESALKFSKEAFAASKTYEQALRILTDRLAAKKSRNLEKPAD
jgi:hypothetical protein